MATTDIPAEIVRAYDIRGTIPDQLNESVARRIGAAFGSWLASRGGHEVAVGHDARASSPTLYEAAIAGLRSVGIGVHTAGLAPTPVIGWAVERLGLDGGLIVTASHNPPEYNGFKLLIDSAQPLWPEEIVEVARTTPVATHECGHRTELDAIGPYLDMLQHRFGQSSGLRVVIDCGHGVTGQTAPSAIAATGATISALRETPQPVSDLAADPQNPDTMRPLARRTVELEAPLGIAWDGDGDRIGVVDHLGRRYEADWLTALLARPLLTRRRAAEVLVDLKTSSSALEDIRRRGGRPISAQTGYSFFRRQMREQRISFGGETSGHIMFGPDYRPDEDAPWIDDGVYAACALLAYLTETDQSLAEAMSPIRPRPVSPELRLPCADADKARVARAIGDWFAERFPSAPIDRSDGARVTLDEGWLHARASNTAPALSLRFEADDVPAYQRIAEQLGEVLALHREVREIECLDEPPLLGPHSLL